MNNQNDLSHYWSVAQLLKSDQAKVVFFDENEEAFNLVPAQAEELENCKQNYCAEKNWNNQETDDFQELGWEEYPNEFKVFAFDYCIHNGIAYEDIQGSMTVDEISSLISLEKLNEKLEDEGLMISEAEDHVMLILEKKIKKTGRTATEDALYDATKRMITNLRDWMDDNHPDNIKAA